MKSPEIDKSEIVDPAPEPQTPFWVTCWAMDKVGGKLCQMIQSLAESVCNMATIISKIGLAISLIYLILQIKGDTNIEIARLWVIIAATGTMTGNLGEVASGHREFVHAVPLPLAIGLLTYFLPNSW